MKKCPICKRKVIGRSDKIFCSVPCKSSYHRRLRNATNKAALAIDKILHRNRSILLEIMGRGKKPIKVSRLILDRKKFNFKYHTHLQINSKGKTYYYIYDFAWMSFSNDEVLIARR